MSSPMTQDRMCKIKIRGLELWELITFSVVMLNYLMSLISLSPWSIFFGWMRVLACVILVLGFRF